MIDTHCHLTSEKFVGRVAEILGEAWAIGVTACVTVATDVADAMAAAELAGGNAGVFFSVGVHPHEAKDADGDYLKRLRDIASGGEGKCVAVGEIGLDYHYDFSPRCVQQKVFSEQLELSAAMGKPVIVHTRQACDDTLAILRAFAGRLTGVIHSFTGQAEEVDKFLDQGWHIGFAGVVTFKRADLNRAAARRVPADRLLVETDSPYLSPEPVRKVFPNVPAHVVHVARTLADVRNVPLQTMLEQTTANAVRLFALP
ncbi:MAG: TatD family hydrolase [Planctomycetes bacterium]|nr:TatD family hydrolase [Planctomycetota bacterium]